MPTIAKHGALDINWLGTLIEARTVSEFDKKRGIVSISAYPGDGTWSVQVAPDPERDDESQIIIMGGHPIFRHLCMLVAEHLSSALEQQKIITHDIVGKDKGNGKESISAP